MSTTNLLREWEFLHNARKWGLTADLVEILDAVSRSITTGELAVIKLTHPAMFFPEGRALVESPARTSGRNER